MKGWQSLCVPALCDGRELSSESQQPPCENSVSWGAEWTLSGGVPPPCPVHLCSPRLGHESRPMSLCPWDHQQS